MRRRDLIAILGAAALSRRAAAEAGSTPVVGLLCFANVEESKRDVVKPVIAALAEAGLVVGRDVRLEIRYAETRFERVPALAADLVSGRPGVIVTGGGNLPVEAAMKATATIPIVFVSGGDPVADHIVESFNHPGGNVTGVAVRVAELGAKRLQLFHDLVPSARSIGLLTRPGAVEEDLAPAAAKLGLTLHVVNAAGSQDFDRSFAEFAALHVDAVMLSALLGTAQNAAAAAAHGLPTFHTFPFEADAGGLASYGPDLASAFRVAGGYAARILKGDRPADLPVVQSDRFAFIINLKTAKALNVEIPSTVLARADEVIE